MQVIAYSVILSLVIRAFTIWDWPPNRIFIPAENGIFLVALSLALRLFAGSLTQLMAGVKLEPSPCRNTTKPPARAQFYRHLCRRYENNGGWVCMWCGERFRMEYRHQMVRLDCLLVLGTPPSQSALPRVVLLALWLAGRRSWLVLAALCDLMAERFGR